MTIENIESIIRKTVKNTSLNLTKIASYPDIYREIQNHITFFADKKETKQANVQVDLISYPDDSFGLDIRVIYNRTDDPDIYLFYSFEDFIYEFVGKHRNVILDDLLS